MKSQDEEPRFDERAPVEERWQERLVDRWVERAGDASPEARAGALLRQAVRRESPDEARLGAIRSRMRRERRLPQRHWTLRLAVAVGLLVSGGALTAAAQRYLHLFVPPSPPPQEHAPPAGRTAHARIGTGATPLAVAPAVVEPVVPLPPPADVVAPPPAEVVAPPPAVVAPPPPAVVAPPPAVVAPPPEEAVRARLGAAATPPDVASGLEAPAADRTTFTAPPSFLPAAAAERSATTLALETNLLAEALRKLRQDQDPPGALALLDEHDVLFPTGVLAPEATLARIEALIQTQRNGDALALLEKMAPPPRGRGRDLLIARAELRAAAGRRPAAAADFDLLLRGDRARDSITERALWGRAACRAATGDGAGARRDLKDYLASFPEGRFVREARAALKP